MFIYPDAESIFRAFIAYFQGQNMLCSAQPLYCDKHHNSNLMGRDTLVRERVIQIV